VLELTQGEARRIAVRAQQLDGSARDVLDTIRRLGFLQLDPTSRVARSHLLVLWSRLGSWDLAELDRLLWEARALFEWQAFIYPIEDLPFYQARMRRYAKGDSAQARKIRQWLDLNAPFRRYVLRELRRRGPLLSRDLENRSIELWESSGWTGGRSASQMLELLNARGEVAVVGRQGGQRLWDLAGRWYPRTETVSAREAERQIAERRVRSLGIVRRGPGVAVRVRGVAGTWVAHPGLLERADDPLPARTTLLSPFDRLIHDRDRAEELFGFRYRMEIYVPKAKREYGYFVLPVLHGDRLVGRVDPEYDRRARSLRVHGVFAEPRGDLSGLGEALERLGAFLGAESVELPPG
jgi:uncharacterized protein YcaQ